MQVRDSCNRQRHRWGCNSGLAGGFFFVFFLQLPNPLLESHAVLQSSTCNTSSLNPTTSLPSPCSAPPESPLPPLRRQTDMVKTLGTKTLNPWWPWRWLYACRSLFCGPVHYPGGSRIWPVPRAPILYRFCSVSPPRSSALHQCCAYAPYAGLGLEACFYAPDTGLAIHCMPSEGQLRASIISQ